MKRRTFMRAVAAGLLLNSVDCAAKIRVPAINRKIVGIGRAGCDIIQSFASNPLFDCSDNFVLSVIGAYELDRQRRAFQVGFPEAAVQFVKLGEPRLCSGRSCFSTWQWDDSQSIQQMRISLDGAEEVIILAGLGGSRGSAVAPEVARMASSIGATSMALVAMPFSFEGERSNARAIRALDEVKTQADQVIAFSNDAPAELLGGNATSGDVFRITDAQMLNALSCHMGQRKLSVASEVSVLCGYA